jgi:hypothetical protein
MQCKIKGKPIRYKSTVLHLGCDIIIHVSLLHRTKLTKKKHKKKMAHDNSGRIHLLEQIDTKI